MFLVANGITTYYAGNVDYNAGPYNVTLLAGNTTGILSIILNDDNLLERIEEFNLTIDVSSLSGDIFPGSHIRALVVIMDNDGNQYLLLFILINAFFFF